MTRVASPRALARSIPGAPSRLLTTRAISAPGMRPAETLSARASKFEPRPLRRMPSRLAMKEETVAQTERMAKRPRDERAPLFLRSDLATKELQALFVRTWQERS